MEMLQEITLFRQKNMNRLKYRPFIGNKTKGDPFSEKQN